MIDIKRRIIIQMLIISMAATIIVQLPTSSVITAFQSPIKQDLIIQYGDSSAEKKAIAILQKQSRATVISADSPLLFLKIQKSKGVIFVVGHGTEEGIFNSGKVLPWDAVAETLRLSHKNVMLISCNSEEIAKKYNYLVGFPEESDAVLAAHIASVLYFSRLKMHDEIAKSIERVRQRAQIIHANPSSVSYLGLSTEEIIGGVISMVFNIISLAPLLGNGLRLLKFFLFENPKATKKMIDVLKESNKFWSVLSSMVGGIINAFSLINNRRFGDDQVISYREMEEIRTSVNNLTGRSGQSIDFTNPSYYLDVFEFVRLIVTTGLDAIRTSERIKVTLVLGLDIALTLTPGPAIISIVADVLSVATGIYGLITDFLTFRSDKNDRNDVYSLEVSAEEAQWIGEVDGRRHAYEDAFKSAFKDMIDNDTLLPTKEAVYRYIESFNVSDFDDHGFTDNLLVKVKEGYAKKNTSQVDITRGRIEGRKAAREYITGFFDGMPNGFMHGAVIRHEFWYYVGFFEEFAEQENLVDKLYDDFYESEYGHYRTYIDEYLYNYTSPYGEAFFPSNRNASHQHGFVHGYRSTLMPTYENWYHDINASIEMGKEGYNNTDYGEREDIKDFYKRGGVEVFKYFLNESAFINVYQHSIMASRSTREVFDYFNDPRMAREAMNDLEEYRQEDMSYILEQASKIGYKQGRVDRWNISYSYGNATIFIRNYLASPYYNPPSAFNDNYISVFSEEYAKINDERDKRYNREYRKGHQEGWNDRSYDGFESVYEDGRTEGRNDASPAYFYGHSDGHDEGYSIGGQPRVPDISGETYKTHYDRHYEANPPEYLGNVTLPPHIARMEEKLRFIYEVDFLVAYKIGYCDQYNQTFEEKYKRGYAIGWEKGASSASSASSNPSPGGSGDGVYYM